jgi:putative oxidoreductase
MVIHSGNGWLFTAPNGGWEYPAFLALAALAQALIGDGAFALRPLSAGGAPTYAGRTA